MSIPKQLLLDYFKENSNTIYKYVVEYGDEDIKDKLNKAKSLNLNLLESAIPDKLNIEFITDTNKFVLGISFTEIEMYKSTHKPFMSMFA